MKCSTTMAMVCCGLLAASMTGCKYDDESIATDDVNAGAEVPTETDPNAGKDVATDLEALKNADSSSLSDATGLPFDQDPNLMRCTDVDFTPVYFGFDASNLPQGEMAKIEAVAKHLQAKPERVVIVEGNCDERGSNEYNLSLGELRAIAIRDYLATLGIAANRIQTKSYGEEKPAVTGSGESAWQKNRRGEFAVFQPKK